MDDLFPYNFPAARRALHLEALRISQWLADNPHWLRPRLQTDIQQDYDDERQWGWAVSEREEGI